MNSRPTVKNVRPTVKNVRPNIRTLALGAAALALAGTPPRAATAQVPGTTTVVGVPATTGNGAGPDDLFAGASVVSYSPLETASSGTQSGFNINDLFGSTTATALEPGSVVFNDSAPPGNVESVVFSTAAPVSLSRFTLTLAANGPYRSTNGFRLYGLSDAAGATSTLLSSVPVATPYSATYGSDFITGGTVFTSAQTYRFYRLEVNYFDNGTGSFNGARLFELQGFGTVAPEPSQCAGLGLGALGLCGLALKARRRKTVA